MITDRKWENKLYQYCFYKTHCITRLTQLRPHILVKS